MMSASSAPPKAVSTGAKGSRSPSNVPPEVPRLNQAWNIQPAESLIESLGPLQLQLRLEVREHRLRYVLERATLLGLPVPQRLAPSLEAWEGERDGRYEFAVDVRLPFIGRLVRYEGLLDLDA